MRKTVNCESLTLAKEAIAPHVPGPYIFDKKARAIRKLRPCKIQRKTEKGAWVYSEELLPEGIPLARIIFDERPEMQSTARLFAAAPELLAALEAILAPFNYGDKIELHNTDDQYHAARAAIAKAKGA